MAQQILAEGVAQATPALGYVTMYAKADGNVYSKDDAGLESILSGGPSAGHIQSQAFTAFTTAGTLTAYTITPAPAITAYAAGQSFFVTFALASGAAPTLTINGIATPPNLVKQIADGTYANIAAGDIPINHRSSVTLLSATQALVEKTFADQSITTAKLADAAVTQAQTKVKAVVALADAAATLTAAQMIDSSIFTITPTVARILTTDTAANLVAALPRYQVGTWFDIIIVNTAAFDVTLAAGTGITLVGKAIINNVSGTWRCRIDSATAVTAYRA